MVLTRISSSRRAILLVRVRWSGLATYRGAESAPPDSIEPTLVYARQAGRLNADARAGTAVNEYSDFDPADSTDSTDRFAPFGFGRSLAEIGEVRWEMFDFRQTPSSSDDQFPASARLEYAARKFLTAGAEVTFWSRNRDGALRDSIGTLSTPSPHSDN